jgi:hypothetical protein
MSNETILDGVLMGAESNYPNDLSSHDLKNAGPRTACQLLQRVGNLRSLATNFLACSKSQGNQACNWAAHCGSILCTLLLLL